MAMMRSWRHAARRAFKGGAFALAAVILATVPGLMMPTGAEAGGPAAFQRSKADHGEGRDPHHATVRSRFHGDAAHARDHGDHGDDAGPGAHADRSAPLAFEGGVEVPRRDLRARFRHGHGHWSQARHGRDDRHHGDAGPVFRVTVRNLGPDPYDAPVILVIDAVRGGHGRARVHRPCGHLPTGEPFVCLLREGTWAPGETTPKADLRFTGAGRVHFTWHVEAMPLSGEANTAPVADAGPDRTAYVGEMVTLDGSACADADGDPLHYAWAIDDMPPGSGARLSDPGAVRPSLTPDLPGIYTFSLVVGDGAAVSAPDTVRVSTMNSPPVADAGPDQSVRVGDPVTLDGTRSSDVDGDPLVFSWVLLSAPPGSAAAPSDPGAVLPTFTADRAGTYEFELVVDDGTDESAPDTVVVTTVNSKPVADAGPDRTVALGSLAALDGAGSYDLDADPLAFSWSLLSVPDGSAAALSDPAAEAPDFVADLPGTYVVQLIVDDGALAGDPDTAVIDTANARPTADAGTDAALLLGDTVPLDGTMSSDPDGDPLGYFWAVTFAPPGSAAAPDDPLAPATGFAPDFPGVYLVQLIVDDGELASAPDTVLITVRPPPTLAVDDVAVREGDAGTTALVFTVTLSAPASGDVRVDFATAPGSASGGIDYVNAAGTLTIPAGATAGTIPVDVLGDTTVEPDETFVVNLSAPVGAALADAQGTGTIANDDTVSLAIGDVTVTEGANGASTTATFHITLTGVLAANQLIQFTTAGATATSGADFGATSGFVTMRAFRNDAIVTVAVLDDTIAEGTETFQVILLDAGSVPITRAVGIGTILDDD